MVNLNRNTLDNEVVDGNKCKSLTTLWISRRGKQSISIRQLSQLYLPSFLQNLRDRAGWNFVSKVGSSLHLPIRPLVVHRSTLKFAFPVWSESESSHFASDAKFQTGELSKIAFCPPIPHYVCDSIPKKNCLEPSFTIIITVIIITLFPRKHSKQNSLQTRFLIQKQFFSILYNFILNRDCKQLSRLLSTESKLTSRKCFDWLLT